MTWILNVSYLSIPGIVNQIKTKADHKVLGHGEQENE